MQLNVNGAPYEVPEDWQDESLLFVLREALGLVGTKYGCGVGQCGACTVVIAGEARRSCLEQVRDLEGMSIETIEGLAAGEELHPVLAAWMEARVPQCGYCQAGQMMAAVALLRGNASPSDADIDAALEGNLCRCGTYQRIRTAIHAAAEALS